MRGESGNLSPGFIKPEFSVSNAMEFKQYSPNTDRDKIRFIWSELFQPDYHSYFLSWGWIETWLDTLPKSTPLTLLVAYRNEQASIAFFIGGPRWRRRTIFPVRSITLNATGQSELDRLWIEYNSILHREDVATDLLELLSAIRLQWHSFTLPGLDVKRFPGCALTNEVTGYSITLLREEPSYFVDLEKVRQADGGYLTQLKSNNRYQLRKARRYYEQFGPLRTEKAESISEAIAFYDELIQLNTKNWSERQQDSAFDSAYFRDFHRELIKRRFPTGEIQILKVTCAEKTVGILYNFVMNKHVYFYQCGLRYDQDSAAKPGLITHWEAVEYNVNRSNNRYDFLAGDAQYKRSLSTDYNLLRWIEIADNRGFSKWINTLEKGAQKIVKRIRKGRNQ
jgi:CelD/BcsL family acetyltransferase involved in cellulose biosynthesis